MLLGPMVQVPSPLQLLLFRWRQKNKIACVLMFQRRPCSSPEVASAHETPKTLGGKNEICIAGTAEKFVLTAVLASAGI